MHAGRGVAAAVLLAGLAVFAGPGTASAAEQEPRDAACRYRDPEVQAKKLTPAESARPTWPQQRLRFTDAWQFGRGQGVTVAVVDSGVDASHPQLRGHVLRGFDLTGGDVEPGADRDCFGHGTMVAGIIAAQPVPGTALSGIAPDVRILPIRQTWGLDDEARPVRGSATTLIAAMRLAVQQAQIVNVSVTVAAAELRPAERAAFEAIARDAAARQVLIVAAAGNKDEYEGKNPVTYPAALALDHDNVLAVAALGPDGAVDQQSITGRFVTVAAPGVGMPCTMDRGGLVPCQGTSFAAPFVSGLAAMIRGRFPELSAAQIKARIIRTADHPSTDLPDEASGYGTINPQASLTFALPGAQPAAIEPARAPLPGAGGVSESTRTLSLVIAGSAVLVVILALVAGLAFPAGRRRRWRPGLRPPVRRSP